MCTEKIDTYTGLSEPSFKIRWGNHKASLEHESQRTDTCLSNHIWDLKDSNIPYTLNFKQLTQAPGYNPVTKQCRLCLSEKYFIMFKPEGATINSKSEFFSSYRHKKSLILCPPPPKTNKNPRQSPKQPPTILFLVLLTLLQSVCLFLCLFHILSLMSTVLLYEKSIFNVFNDF